MPAKRLLVQSPLRLPGPWMDIASWPLTLAMVEGASAVSAQPALILTTPFELAVEVAKSWVAHWGDAVPWVGVWFGLSVVSEYIIPAIWPHAYDALGKDGKLATATQRAADARTKIVAVAMALLVTTLGLYGRWISGDYQKLQRDLYATSPLATLLNASSAAFFVWDIWCCIVDRLAIEYYVHGILAFISFSLMMGTTPEGGFCAYMAFVALIMELSTIFLHARKGLIQAQLGHGLLFRMTELAFAGSFFWARIIVGFGGSYQWQKELLELHHSGKSHSTPVIFFCFVAALGNYVLQSMWMIAIIRMALKPRSNKKHK